MSDSENWWERPFISLDFESTGVNPDTARAVTATVIRIDPATGDKRVAEWMINPGIEIPAEATAVHGISTEQARAEGMDAAKATEEIAALVSDAWYEMRPCVVYNAPYDCTLLDREMRRHGIGELDCGPVIDPLVLDRQFDRFRPKRVAGRKLIEVAKHYGVELSEQDAHGSSADALAAGRVTWRILAKFPKLREMRLPELHAAQIEWYAQQSEHHREFLAKLLAKAKPDECADLEAKIAAVNYEWPLRAVAS